MEENLRLANSIAAKFEQALTLSEADRAAGCGHRDVAGGKRMALSEGKTSGRKAFSYERFGAARSPCGRSAN